MSPDELNSFLEHNSYLGSTCGVTLEDYKQCREISAVDEERFPHLHRWHAHVSYLSTAYPEFDWRGERIPAGALRLGSGSSGSTAKAEAPKKGGEPKKDDKPKKEAPKKEEPKKEAPKKEEPKKEAPKKEEPKKEAPKKEEPKKEAPKKAPKEDGKKKEEPAAPAGDPEKARKDKLKKVVKEGGKRGVEIEGSADMGGLQFFCCSVDCPEGDTDLLAESLKAMNVECDPTEEERKGGSGKVGKMIFSAGAEQLAVVAYVPEAKQAELSCAEWIQAVVGAQGGEVLSTAKDVCVGRVKADSDKGVFPLKIREPMILEANNFLRKRGLFPEDDGDDDDEEYVYGDDDFPSM
eukprot:CAMPEP_0179226948 /NCGR_PEP_ID=MMETSP0797-20121207/9071_1 /TAXON_ID=47934 /ORGANISM="Dinophysis acuminata, Strain DAEP01" /LENGTH=348 /DNA_ID=CAMNT_0020933981 /DNA_START=84 /DNA_END=1130 /DNA_ORIENTATION=-